MAFVTETETYEAGIRQLEITDQVLGGANQVSNTQAIQLANRTKYLKAHVDTLETYKKKFSAVVIITGDTTLTASDYGKLYVVAGSAGAVNITLAAIVAGHEGFSVSIENKSSFAVNVNRAGPDTIDGLNTKQLAYSGDSLTLVVDESATNFVIKSAILKTSKISNQYTNATIANTSVTYVDLTSLTFTTPNDGITRRYILDYSGSFSFTGAVGQGGKVQILAGATQVAYGENFFDASSLGTATFKSLLTCKCCVDIAANTVVKVQIKNVDSTSADFINNVLIVDEK